MGMLDRYKKKGGYSQLLQLLETSAPSKREQFLGLIATESSVWEESLKKHILTINRVYSWDGQYLVEIFTRVPPLLLATVLFGKTNDEVDKILSCLPPISKRKITDLMLETNPTPIEQSSAVFKLLSEIRNLFAQGILRMDRVDPGLVVAENIEEALNAAANPVPAIDLEVVLKGEPKLRATGSSAEASELQHEIDLLKRKLVQYSAEVNLLKQENGVLKDKLAQIRKIA